MRASGRFLRLDGGGGKTHSRNGSSESNVVHFRGTAHRGELLRVCGEEAMSVKQLLVLQKTLTGGKFCPKSTLISGFPIAPARLIYRARSAAQHASSWKNPRRLPRRRFVTSAPRQRRKTAVTAPGKKTRALSNRYPARPLRRGERQGWRRREKIQWGFWGVFCFAVPAAGEQRKG